MTVAVGTHLHGEMPFFESRTARIFFFLKKLLLYSVVCINLYFILLSSSSPRSRADGFYSGLIGPGGLSEIGGHSTTIYSVKYDKR